MKEKTAEELFKEKIEKEIKIKDGNLFEQKESKLSNQIKDIISKVENSAAKKYEISDEQIDNIFKLSDEIINQEEENVDTTEIEDLYKQIDEEINREEIADLASKVKEEVADTEELKKMYDNYYKEEVETKKIAEEPKQEKFADTAELKKIFDSIVFQEEKQEKIIEEAKKNEKPKETKVVENVTQKEEVVKENKEVPKATVENKKDDADVVGEIKRIIDNKVLEETKKSSKNSVFEKTNKVEAAKEIKKPKDNIIFKETNADDIVNEIIKKDDNDIKQKKAENIVKEVKTVTEKPIDKVKDSTLSIKLPKIETANEIVKETNKKAKYTPPIVKIEETIKKTENIINKTVDVIDNEVKEIKKEFTSTSGGNGGNNDNKDRYGEGEKEPRPKTTKGVKTLAIIVSVIVCLGIICAIGAAVFGFSLLKDMPEFDENKLLSADSSIIYDANGNEVVELGLYLRESIDYEEMPNSLIDAFLSIEDSRFFQHFGFDIPRFTKAAISNLTSGGFGQGGSTMTMQLVKNSYFQIDADGQSTLAASSGMAGVKRKAQEIVLAIECDKQLDKKEIISLYINKINFGNNIRGAQKAAEYYFGKNANELNLVESCFLAGIINSPNNYNPYNELYKNDDNYIYLNPNITYLENAQERTAEVLDLMAYHGYISDEEARLAKTIKIEDLLVGADQKFKSYNEYYQDFIDAVLNEAEEVTGKDPYTTSMDIYTTMDPYMQRLVYEIESEQTEFQYSRDLEQSAFVVLNNQTGELVALGGGRNQAAEARQFNRATNAYLQPGSVMKPILEYALAFDRLGWSTAHTITDKPVYLYNSKILIVNAGGQEYTGDMLVTEAIARSLNSPAIQTLEAVLEEMEEDGVKDYLKQIGFTRNIDSFDLQWGIGGNTCVITPAKLAAAHGMLINDGYYVEPHTISRIEIQNGDTYVADTTGKQVISSAAAYMTAMCEENNVSGEFFNLMQILKRDYPVYAKTGTTDWGSSGRAYGIPYGAPKDMWMVAQTSNYTVTVWLGFDKAEKGAYFTSSEDMANLKGRICKYLLDELETHFDYNPHAIEKPDDVTSVEIVKGAYPYCAPDGAHETVTGLIKASALEEHPLTSVEEVLANLPVKEETEAGGSAIKGFVRAEDGVVVVESFSGGYWCSEGTQNISATNLFGDSTAAVGRCYFPHYVTTGSSYDTGYVTLYVNGEYWNSKETVGYTEFYDVPTEGAELMACLNDSACTTFRR